jgi:hypothetical protein
MKITLNPDKELIEWKVFEKIIDLIDSRKFSQEMAKNSLNPVERYRLVFKVFFLACFSQYTVNEIVKELNNYSKLRKFCNIDDQIDYKQLMKWYSEPKADNFLEVCLKTINKLLFTKKMLRIL